MNASKSSDKREFEKKEIWVATPPATSRHTSHKPWLLPSGPDQVDKLSLRENQWGNHSGYALISGANYHLIYGQLQGDLCRLPFLSAVGL